MLTEPTPRPATPALGDKDSQGWHPAPMSDPRPYATLRMQRDNLLLAVSRGAAKLVRARRWRFAMDEVLGDVGTAARVDRAWLFRIFPRSDGDLRTSLWHEWGAAGTGFVSLRADPAFANMPVRGPRHDHTLSIEHMLAHRLYSCADTRTLPAAARVVLDRLGIRSVLRTPVLRNGQLWGALGFDSVRTTRPWLDSEQEALAALSTILTALLEREARVNVLWSAEHAQVPAALHAAAAAAIAELHASDPLEEGIARALELVAMALRAQRVWLSDRRQSADGVTHSVVAQEWMQPGLPLLKRSGIAELNMGGPMQRWYDDISAGSFLRVTRATAASEELAALDAAGVDQFVAVPVPGMLQRWHGTLAASRPVERPFTDPEVQMLEAVADSIHAARDRRQAAP